MNLPEVLPIAFAFVPVETLLATATVRAAAALAERLEGAVRCT
jgi:hypothetical protein